MLDILFWELANLLRYSLTVQPATPSPKLYTQYIRLCRSVAISKACPRRPQMSDQNRNTFVSIRGRDVSLAELHLAFGEKLPEFTQRRWGRSKFVPAGECRDVILALPNGSLPERINAEAKHGTVIVMDWSKQYFFRLLDDGQSRCIVAGNGRKDVGGRAYRRWLGVSEGFEKTDYAFPVLKIRDYFKKEDSSSRHLSPVPRDSASIRDMSNAHGSDESGDDVMDTTARAEVSASRRNTGDLDVSSRMNSRNRRYDISEIIRSDRAHYGTSQPPFTSKRSRDAQPPISASLLDKNGIATKQKLQISTEPYSSLYSYHITTIKGARYIVKLVEGGERGIHYRIWYGHARGFGTDSMALPSQEAGSARKSSVQREDHESDASNASISGNAQQTRNGLHPGRNPTPTSALPPARKPTVSRSQEEILAQMPRKGTQKVPEFRTGRWNQDRWIAQIRHFYGQSRPEFVRDKGNNKPGDKKQVRDSGQYTVQSSRRYSLLTCYEWNSDAVVWVSQIVRRCYIVSSFKVDDRIVWRRWHGPGKGFSTKTVRFEEDSAEANDNSEDSFLGMALWQSHTFVYQTKRPSRSSDVRLGKSE